MGEDLGDGGGVEDGGEDRQGTAAVGTPFHVDIEHPLEQLGPAQAGRRRGRTCLTVAGYLSIALTGGLGTIWGRSLALGASTPWKRMRCSLGRGTSAARRCMNSSGPSFHHDMGGAIVVGAFKSEHDLTGTIACQALVGKGWPGNVSAQVFELMALVDGATHFGMQAEALLVDTTWVMSTAPLGSGRSARSALFARRAARRRYGRCRPPLPRAPGAIGIGGGEVNRSLLFNEVALARQ